MTNSHSPTPFPSPPRSNCFVCGEPATAMTSGNQPICTDAGCRIVASKQATMPPGEFGRLLMQQVQLKRSHRHATGYLNQLLIAKRDAESVEAEQLWSELKNLESVQEVNCETTVNIPSGPRQTVAVSEERREALARKLVECAEEVSRTDPLDQERGEVDETTAPSEPVYEQLCTMCRGSCCITGYITMAFLDAATFRRVLAANPEMSLAELREKYQSPVPLESIENSCIYHTSTGCALPRDLRADICNSFFCPSLVQLRTSQSTAERPLTSVVAIQRRQLLSARDCLDLKNDIVASALITETSIRVLTTSVDVPEDAIPCGNALDESSDTIVESAPQSVSPVSVAANEHFE